MLAKSCLLRRRRIPKYLVRHDGGDVRPESLLPPEQSARELIGRYRRHVTLVLIRRRIERDQYYPEFPEKERKEMKRLRFFLKQKEL